MVSEKKYFFRLVLRPAEGHPFELRRELSGKSLGRRVSLFKRRKKGGGSELIVAKGRSGFRTDEKLWIKEEKT